MGMHELRLVVLSSVAWLVIGSKRSETVWHMQEERSCSRYYTADLERVAGDFSAFSAGGFIRRFNPPHVSYLSKI